MEEKHLGKYTLVEKLAEGGMGEIYLARDPECERIVALKKIKPSLLSHERVRTRFIREAKLASKLSHPSIVPIYAIHNDEECYYTMPYVRGETLKKIIRQTLEADTKGESPHSLGISIPQLIRTFLSICQATDYAHSNGILHRDIKSENILVGTFGEVLIIDWGLACHMKEQEDDSEILQAPIDPELTLPGKVVGTIAYMAPERAFGHKATVATEIYALGVILYQLLTLHLPFQRKTLKEFRKKAKFEKLIDPSELAPHRDIPAQLVKCVYKCLAFRPEDRYESVHSLIIDIERYIEGSPEWSFSRSLQRERPDDWEFQENILLAKHIAITRVTDVMEWMMLMISKESFTGNARFEFEYTPHTGHSGLGFLCNIPKPHERKSLEDGYLVWLGNKDGRGVSLFRTNVEVFTTSELCFEKNTTYHICVEKIDNLIRVSVDGELKLNYLSHIPMVGGHLGLLYKDALFSMSKISIFTGSHSVMVNCLSVPDAFLNSHDYDTALEEYQKISRSFRGRMEGREAIFRAGLTLLEMGKAETNANTRSHFFSSALDEFNQLHNTPGAPLEYLGKSLVYKAEKDLEEEIKCLELGIRRFKTHPLLYMLEEHVLFRLLESSQSHRKTAYYFALLSLQHLPRVLEHTEVQNFFHSLARHIEIPYFIEKPASFSNNEEKNIFFSILLAFWLAKPITLYEILNTLPANVPNRPLLLANALYALNELECSHLTSKILTEFEHEPEFYEYRKWLTINSLAEAFSCLSKEPRVNEVRRIVFLFRKHLFPEKAQEILHFFEGLKNFTISTDCAIWLKHSYIWALLLSGKYEKAGEMLRPYIRGAIKDYTSPFFSLYGAYLLVTEGMDIAMVHFQGVFETKYPPTQALLGHFLLDHIEYQKESDPWMKGAFLWEKLEFFRYLILHFSCLKKKRKALATLKIFQSTLTRAQIPLDFL